MLTAHSESATREQRARFKSVARQTARTIVLATGVAVCVVLAVLAVIVGRMRPAKEPKLAILFLVAVHVAAEGTVSAALLYATRLQVPLRSLSCCKRWSQQALLDVLTNDASEDDRLTESLTTSMASTYQSPSVAAGPASTAGPSAL